MRSALCCVVVLSNKVYSSYSKHTCGISFTVIDQLNEICGILTWTVCVYHYILIRNSHSIFRMVYAASCKTWCGVWCHYYYLSTFYRCGIPSIYIYIHFSILSSSTSKIAHRRRNSFFHHRMYNNVTWNWIRFSVHTCRKISSEWTSAYDMVYG